MKRALLVWFATLCLIVAAFGQTRDLMSLMGAGKGAPGGGAASVALSATGTKLFSGAAITKAYTGITVNSGDKTLEGSITFDINDGTLTPTAVTAIWDVVGANQSMSLIIDGTPTGGNGGATFIFCVQNPTAGNKTLTFAWTGSVGSFINALSFTGSNTGCQNGVARLANPPDGPTVAVTSGTGHIVVAGGSTGGAIGTLTSAGNTCPTGSPTCVVYSDSSSGSAVNAFLEIGAGAGTPTTTIGTSNNVHLSGIDVAP